MSYQGATLGIMSSDTFKNRTQATRAVCGRSARFKSRGNNMDSIDHALAEWERKCNNPQVDSFQKTAMLRIIERECESWIGRKRGKSSNLANFRRGTIEELRVAAKKAAAYMVNKYHTEQKIAQNHNRLGGGRVPTKSLDGNYALERQDYLGRGKAENPRAAGAMGMAGHNLDTMSLQEYAQAEVESVYYHNRAERMQYMTFIEGGRFYDGTSVANDPVEDGFSGTKKCVARMYAVDKYGNLFSKVVRGFDGTYFNHSSFCAGKEIICAGTVVFAQGALRYISTNSGHYKPAPPQLRTYLTSIAGEDVDLSSICVYVKDRNGARHLRSNSFMQNVSAPTDWPNFDDQNRPVVTIGGQQVYISEPA